MFYKKIMVFLKGIYYNKKYVKMEKSTFYTLIWTLMYEWGDLSDEAQNQFIESFRKVLDY